MLRPYIESLENNVKSKQRKGLKILGLGFVIEDVMPTNIAENTNLFARIRINLIFKCEAIKVVHTTLPNMLMPFHFLNTKRGMLHIFLE